MTRMLLSSLAAATILAMTAGGAVSADAAKAKRSKATGTTGTAKEANTEAITLTHEKLVPTRRSGASRRRAR